MKLSRTLLLSLALVAAGSATAGLAIAGAKSGTAAWVNVQPDNSGYAGGDLSTTRNSSDNTDYIGCQIIKYENQPNILICFARGNNLYGYCRTSDADMIQTALGANGDDYLSFDFAPDGHCRTVFVDKSSMHGPKY
jgi:hypothetical protein